MPDDADPDRRHATYGPVPPSTGIVDPLDTCGQGKNCVFARDNGQPVARLAALPVGYQGLASLPVSRSRTARGVLTPPRRTGSTAICSAFGSSASPCGSRRSRRRRGARTRSSSATPASRGKPRGSYRTWRCTLTWRCGTPRGRRPEKGREYAKRGRPTGRRREQGIALVAALVVMALIAAIRPGPGPHNQPRAAGRPELRNVVGGHVCGRRGRGHRRPRVGVDRRLGPRAERSGGVLDPQPVGGDSRTPRRLERRACGVDGPGDAATPPRVQRARPTPSRPSVPGARTTPGGSCSGTAASINSCPPAPERADRGGGRVGDDPADLDGDPYHDTRLGPAGEWRRGACVVAIRAEAFAPRFGHRTVVATVGRPDPGADRETGVVSWRGLH